MAVMSIQSTIAANTRSANLLAGLEFEFVPAASIIRVFCTGAAVGLRLDFLIGGESLAADALVPGTNRFPLREEDGLVEHGGLPGERLFLTLRNTTGAGIVGNVLVDVIPL